MVVTGAQTKRALLSIFGVFLTIILFHTFLVDDIIAEAQAGNSKYLVSSGFTAYFFFLFLGSLWIPSFKWISIAVNSLGLFYFHHILSYYSSPSQYTVDLFDTSKFWVTSIFTLSIVLTIFFVRKPE